MADVKEESASSINVRDLIFAYERQTSSVEPLESYEGRQRTKSIGNALSYKLFRQPNLEIRHLVDIEKELVKIEAHLNYYEVYEKETHVAFQEQLFNILTFIASIDPDGHESTTQQKKDLVAETQKLARVLNAKLPFEINHYYRGGRRIYSDYVRKQEAVVSTTSVKTQEHKALLSSTLNGNFKSEDSLISTKDSVDLSSISNASIVDVNKGDETPQPATPPPQQKTEGEEDTNDVPSVSKLRKFFSFRRNDKAEVKVIPAAYSGVTRSQSLNLKTSRYTVVKRERSKESKETIRETVEDNEQIGEVKTNEQIEEENKEKPAPVEPTKEIEVYKEVESETQHSVSVTKLKGLFEDKRKETEEGLGLLTKKQTEFRTGFNLPYTEANLGAFRLKQTISGNYMSFTGLLRNVDIHKGSDLNKSKSMSDLKSYNFGQGEIDEKLNEEIDSDNGEDDFEHVPIDVGKESTEINKNGIEKTVETTEKVEAQEATLDETYMTGKVEFLKRNFESLSTTTSTSEHKSSNFKHVIQRGIEPIPKPRTPRPEGLVVTESVDFSIGMTDFGHSEEVSGSTTTEKSNDAIKYITHRTIEPISSSDKSAEPVLKVPIQLRTGFVNATQSKEVKEIAIESRTETKSKIQTVSNVPEPKQRVPVQLRVGVISSSTIQEANENKGDAISKAEVTSSVESPTFQTQRASEDISSSTLNLNQSIQISSELQGTFEKTAETQRTDIQSKSKVTSNDESSRATVPLQARIDVINISTAQTTSENTTEKKPEAQSKVETAQSITVPVETLVGVVSTNAVQEEITKLEVATEDKENNTKIEDNLSSTSTQESSGRTTTNFQTVKSVEDSGISLRHLVIEAPIQLQTWPITTVETIYSTEGSQHVVERQEDVTVLTQKYENLSRVNSKENTEITAHCQTIESVDDSGSTLRQLVIETPIQLKTGSISSVEIHTSEGSQHVIKSAEEVTSGKVEVLTQQYENLSQSNSEESTDITNTAHHQTLEYIDNSGSSLKQLVIETPTHLKSESISSVEIHTSESSQHVVTSEEEATSGKEEVLTQQYENLGQSNAEERTDITNTTHHQTLEYVDNSGTTLKQLVIETPVQLKTESISSVEIHTSESSQHVVTSEEEVTAGKVEVLTQQYDNLSQSNSEESTDITNTAHHQTLEYVDNSGSSLTQLVIETPIQLKTGSISSVEIHTSEGSQHVVTSEEEVTAGKVEVLTQQYENLSQTNSQESTEGVSIVDQKTVHSSEETVLKAPLETQFHSSSEAYVSNEEASSITTNLNQSAQVSSGTVEALKEAYEHLSRSDSQDTTDNASIIIHRSEQSVEYNTNLSGEGVLKAPAQLRTESTNSLEVNRTNNNFIDAVSITEQSNVQTTSDIDSVETSRTVLKVPAELRINDVVINDDNADYASSSSAVPISLYNGNQLVREESESKATPSRAQIQSKTESFMKILESPVAFSTLVSSSYNKGQQASGSSTLSYSQNRTVQHSSSTQYSQKTFSSSSSSSQFSQLSTGKYLQVLQQPSSYSLLSSRTPSDPSNEESITEHDGGDIEDTRIPNVNLRVSQENLLNEILEGSDVFENVDEKFEKLLEENS